MGEAYVRVPGDISAEEIEQRYQRALAVIRHKPYAGPLEITGAVRDRPRAMGEASEAILTELANGPLTIRVLAARLHKDIDQISGLTVWLRKTQRIEVKRWTWSEKRRRVAVYGLKDA